MSGQEQFIAMAMARAVHLATCAIVAALLLFECFDSRQTGRWLMRMTLMLALLSGIAWFVLITMDMAGVSLGDLDRPTLYLVWSQTHFGKLWQWRALMFVAMAIALAITRSPSPGNPGEGGGEGDFEPETVSAIRNHPHPLPGPLPGYRKRKPITAIRMITLLLAMSLLCSLAWAGHGQTGRAPLLHVVADVLHLLATSVWPAGLLPLLLRYDQWRADGWRLILRYSTAALWTVIALWLTGLVNACCLIASLRDLIDQSYGRWLIAKVVLMIGLIALGAINRIHLRAKGDDRKLRRNVAIELIVGGMIMGIVGVLGLLSPTHG